MSLKDSNEIQTFKPNLNSKRTRYFEEKSEFNGVKKSKLKRGRAGKFSRSSEANDKFTNNFRETEDPFPGKAPINEKKIQKYSRVEDDMPSYMKTKFSAAKYANTRIKNVFALEQAAKSDMLLLEESGYIEADEGENTLNLTQKIISDSVDITSATKYFDLKLVQFGPYTMDYSRNGRYLLIGGRKGHVAAMDWGSKSLKCEINVMEQVQAVKWFHQETLFAVAQKKWTFVYDNQGIELHCVKALDNVLRMEFLPYHFLLATSNAMGYLSWVDITIGKMVAQFQSRKGRLDVMCQNPYNSVLALGHPQGVVTMWSPSMREPLLSMLCHKRPVRAIAIEQTGKYMATAAIDHTMKIWDLRKLNTPLNSYYLSGGASQLVFSQTNLIAASIGNVVEVYKDCCTQNIAKPLIRHGGKETINEIQFCPYEDVLGIGNLGGFTSIIVPGAGEANFDALECNPYQTKTQRKEAEVKALLDKIQPELICLDPHKINQLDMPTLKEKIEAKKKILFVKPPEVDFEPRHKKKGRSGSKKDLQRKKGVQEFATQQFFKDLNLEKIRQGKTKKQPKKSTGCLLTDRFQS